MNRYQKALDAVGHQSFDEQGRRMTVEDIALRIGDPPTRLRKELSAYDDAHPLKAEKVVPLTLATRNDALIRYFCDETGFVPVKLPQVQSTGHQDVVKQSEVLIKEFGEVLASAGIAVADGNVSVSDAESFEKEAREAIAVIAQFIELMNAKANRQQPAVRPGAERRGGR